MTPSENPPPRIGSRDYFRWDEHHHQPHTDLSGLRKFLHSWRDAGDWLHLAGRNLRHLPAVAKSYRRVRHEERPPRVAAAEFFGIAISPTRATWSRYLEQIETLGNRSLLVRVPVWDPDPVFDLAGVFGELQDRGFRFSFALLQDREAVVSPDRWGSFVRRAAENLGFLEPAFQIGQAFNRKKWGVWRPSEYFEMLAAMAPAREAAPRARWIGPSVIDFEYYYTLHWLFQERPFRFDGIAALLYCDRRGSPDRFQYWNFDLRRKIELLRALVDVSPEGNAPLHLTEFNWPLRGDPKHSPAGLSVMTTEALQARYLVLYYMTAAATGLVTDAYWWQLVANGYGLLADDAQWSERPAWRAFRTLVARASGAAIAGLRCGTGPLRGFVLERAGRTAALLYTSGEEVALDPELRIVEAASIEGEPVASNPIRRLSPDPVWLEFDAISSQELRTRLTRID